MKIQQVGENDIYQNSSLICGWREIWDRRGEVTFARIIKLESGWTGIWIWLPKQCSYWLFTQSYVLDANCAPGMVLGTRIQKFKHGCPGSWQVMAEQSQMLVSGLLSHCVISPLTNSIASLIASPSPQEIARHFLRTTPSPAPKSLAVPTVERQPRLLPSSLIILAFWRKELDCFTLQISKHPINTTN